MLKRVGSKWHDSLDVPRDDMPFKRRRLNTKTNAAPIRKLCDVALLSLYLILAYLRGEEKNQVTTIHPPEIGRLDP